MDNNTISICIVGAVSSGKSTLLNAIFLEQLSDMKIKRTTMVPQSYTEKSDITVTNAVEINRQTTEINNRIIRQTENNQKFTIEQCQEMDFFVSKIDHFDILLSGINFKIFDIPGLNDFRTKDVYFEYINKNYYKFDIIILMIDIMSGLNTNDEKNILELLLKNTRECYDKYNKHIQILVVANKCDDLMVDSNGYTLPDELDEMFKQIQSTVLEKAKVFNISFDVNNIIPLCASNAFLYRMLQKKPTYRLEHDQINKIGRYAMGVTTFNKLSEIEKLNKVREIINDQYLITDMIKLSGFQYLSDKLKNKLDIQTQFKILFQNLMIRLMSIPESNPVTFTDVLVLYEQIFTQLYELKKIFMLIEPTDDNSESDYEDTQQIPYSCWTDSLRIISRYINEKIEKYFDILPKINNHTSYKIDDIVKHKDMLPIKSKYPVLYTCIKPLLDSKLEEFNNIIGIKITNDIVNIKSISQLLESLTRMLDSYVKYDSVIEYINKFSTTHLYTFMIQPTDLTDIVNFIDTENRIKIDEKLYLLELLIIKQYINQDIQNTLQIESLLLQYSNYIKVGYLYRFLVKVVTTKTAINNQLYGGYGNHYNFNSITQESINKNDNLVIVRKYIELIGLHQ